MTIIDSRPAMFGSTSTVTTPDGPDSRAAKGSTSSLMDSLREPNSRPASRYSSSRDATPVGSDSRAAVHLPAAISTAPRETSDRPAMSEATPMRLPRDGSNAGRDRNGP